MALPWYWMGSNGQKTTIRLSIPILEHIFHENSILWYTNIEHVPIPFARSRINAWKPCFDILEYRPLIESYWIKNQFWSISTNSESFLPKTINSSTHTEHQSFALFCIIIRSRAHQIWRNMSDACECGNPAACTSCKLSSFLVPRKAFIWYNYSYKYIRCSAQINSDSITIVSPISAKRSLSTYLVYSMSYESATLINYSFRLDELY